VRSLIYMSLMANEPLQAIIEARLYPAGSLGEGDIPESPERPYVQYGFDAQVPYTAVREGGGPLRHLLRVSYYNDRGDYLRIDEIHALVRQTVEGLTLQVDPTTGKRCTDSMFLTLGGDLTDNVRNLAVKQATFRLVAR
jgi:hypothetical protein